MVTFVNKLTVHGDHDAFLAVRDRLTAFMTSRPGYVSHQQLRGLGPGPDPVHLEIAVWESAEAHRAAVTSEEFQSIVRDLKPLVSAEPGMYEDERQPALAGAGAVASVAAPGRVRVG
ncbi:antibiotic biosynthesis monooxygenase family protein [Streptomyces sp. NPDC002851]